MSLAMVRCPACLGASRVTADALGEVVACPRCEVPFVAAEEVPVVVPARTAAGRTAASAIPVAPPRRRPRRERAEASANGRAPDPSSDSATAPAIPDPEHDPHRPPIAGLPVSVLVGLALLPFGIPALWWATPAITGQEAALSLAVPVALAVAASALCLGVVYTIDWSAATRIKGVLMLVALSYLAAAGLFFLKKDLMDRIRAQFTDSEWHPVKSPEGDFWAKMPVKGREVNDQPLAPKVRLAAGMKGEYRAESEETYVYLMAASAKGQAVQPDDAWFDGIRAHLALSGNVNGDKALADHPGREWTVRVGDSRVRVVRVFVVNGRVYYLSVEGHQLTANDELAKTFFDSFVIKKPDEKP